MYRIYKYINPNYAFHIFLSSVDKEFIFIFIS